MKRSAEEQLALIRTHTIDLIPEDELLAKLRSGRPLRVKYGVDPSGPDIHIGHCVPIRKLRLFQDLGHTAVLIIGDFTGMIGDPSGREDSRRQLTREQVEENMATYRDQVFKILDREKTEFHYNSEWLGKLTPEQIIRLASTHTVAQLMARDDFAQRYQAQQPISLHEFLYPIFQGYDSVAVQADIEIGGTDQKFNFLVARELQSAQHRELTRFLYEGPTDRRWRRLLHAGAGTVALDEWLTQHSTSPALERFWGEWSATLQSLIGERQWHPLVDLDAQLVSHLDRALRDDDTFHFQESLRARSEEIRTGKEQPAVETVLPQWGKPQCIITFPLLVGTDGAEKMGKSLNNYIGVNEPPDQMFGKVMSIPDEVIEQYFELCTDVTADEIAQMKADMNSGALNPRDAKRRLGREIVTLYHRAEAAQKADETFLSVFSASREQTREDYEAVAERVAIPQSLRGKPVWISTALAELGLAASRGEARRLVQGGGVYLDERRISDPQEEIELAPGQLLRVGKRRVARLARD